MDAAPAYTRAVSLHLSRTLEEIGLTTAMIQRRRKTWLYNEQVQNVFLNLIGDNYTVYHFGSQTEGSTTPGLHSDLDLLSGSHTIKVILDWVDWEYDKTNLLMLQEDTAPGYCRLQLLKTDVPMAEEEPPNEHYIFDDSGRVILKNTAANQSLPGDGRTRHGPAVSEESNFNTVDYDYVVGFPCGSMPKQAEMFTRRRRKSGWPSQDLVQKAVKHGLFVVPVGFKLSQTEELEWRLSASLAERELIFSLKTVHIKCYVVLKMLIKRFVEPEVEKCISSYHCKTAMLYCVEDTDPEFWRDDNLLQCVVRCLEKLLAWINDGFCPQFIFSEENLFAGKVTAENKDALNSIFTTLINSNGRALLYVSTDDLRNKLESKLKSEPTTLPVGHSSGIVTVFGDSEYNRHARILDCMTAIMSEEKTMKEEDTIRSVHRRIVLLQDRRTHSNNMFEKAAVHAFIKLLSCWLGSLLASVSLSRKMKVPRIAIQLLRTGAKYDVSTMLKLASILYCDGKFHKVELILQRLETQSGNNDILSVCMCYAKPLIFPQELKHMLFVLKGKKARLRLFADCVRFSSHEAHCVPPELRHELTKSTGDDAKERDPIQDAWMDLAAVDFLPYLYYLQYMTYRQLGKQDLQKGSIGNLDRCVKGSHGFGHAETAWNLLGQCRELEGNVEAATACYRASLEIRPRNNAANLHLRNIRYTRKRKAWHFENLKKM